MKIFYRVIKVFSAVWFVLGILNIVSTPQNIIVLSLIYNTLVFLIPAVIFFFIFRKLELMKERLEELEGMK